MPLDMKFIALVDWLDANIDLTYTHATVTFMCAVAAFWVMQCLTQHAGFFSARKRGLLALRSSLALLSIGLALNCAFVIQADVTPYATDTFCRFLLLFVLVTVPYALPAHLRRVSGVEFKTSSVAGS